MSLIDQRILIAAPAEAIWDFLSDPVLMAKWNKVYKQIQVISTKATGASARRRCILDNGKSVVEELTAWLDNIGYEYRVVDGPFEQFRGRFRLQGMPDGTIVNWTVEYKLRGFMGGLVDATTYKGKQEDLMANSLRLLRRAVEATGARLDPEEQKRFAMQSGPSLEERSARIMLGGGQMPASGDSRSMDPVVTGDDGLPDMPAVAATPTVTPTDTPNAAPTSDTGGFVPSFAAEPEATAQIHVADKTDTKPRPPKSIHENATPLSVSLKKAQELQAQEPEVDPAGLTVPISLVAPPPVKEPEHITETVNIPATPIEPTKAVPPQPDTLPEHIPTSPMPAVQIDEPPVDIRDTKDVSIWDVFGVERPSVRATAELKAIVDSIQRRADEEPDSPEAQRTAALDSPSAPSTNHSRSSEKKAHFAKVAIAVRGVAKRSGNPKVKLPIKSAR